MPRTYQRLPETVDTNWLIFRCAEVGIKHAHIAALFNVSVATIDKRLAVLRRRELDTEIPGQLSNEDWVTADG